MYTLGSNPAERQRLRQQATDLRPHAVALLEHVQLEPGARALDLGCGPAGIIELLSERVGASGAVTGLDIDPVHVALAQELVTEQSLANVTILQGDARRSALPSSSFDLVHARTVLVNIPRPAEMVAEMVRLARPGGWVAGQEPDMIALCHPPFPAWDRLCEVFHTVYQQDGANPWVGRALPDLYRQAGLVDVGVEVYADAFPVGHSRRTILPDLLRSLRPKILERGVLDEQELDALDRAVRDHLDDPRTLAIPFLLFQVWGRKPLV